MAKKKKTFQKPHSEKNTVQQLTQVTTDKRDNKNSSQVGTVQEKKPILQKLHQDYGFTAALASIAVAIIGGVILLYINGKLPFSNTEKPSEVGKEILDTSNRISVQNNNYKINRETKNTATNIQKSQSFQNNFQQDKSKLYEVHLRNDTYDAVSYQFYDYGMGTWVISTIDSGREERILSIESRVLFGLEDDTGDIYILNTNEITKVDANITQKITYDIRMIDSKTGQDADAKEHIYGTEVIWKVFSGNKEILPEPSLNILNNKNVFFTP